MKTSIVPLLDHLVEEIMGFRAFGGKGLRFWDVLSMLG